MKRAITLGLMAVGLIVASLFTAAPAMAAVTCPQIDMQTTWPHGQWTHACTGTTHGADMLSAAAGTQGSSPNAAEMRRANNRNFNDDNGVTFYLFHNPADYASSSVALGLGNPLVIGTDFRNKDFGVTKFNAQGVPVYTAIFEVNGAGDVATTNRIRNATAHEVGNSLDLLMGYIKNGGIVPPTLFRVTDTTTGGAWRTIFQDELTQDWNALNAQLSCGAGSVFRGFQDENGTYMCNGVNGQGTALQGPYVGKTNQQVLELAWPKAFGSVGSAAVFGPVLGVFGEEYARVFGGNDTADNPKTADIYFTQSFAGRTSFACSNWFTQYIQGHGTLPVAGQPGVNMPAGCVDPATLMTTKCQKIWDGNVANKGHFPDGNIFNCSLAGNASQLAVAGTVEGGLVKLGDLGQPPFYTSIKKDLTISQANVYVFIATADYTNSFTAANQPVAGMGGVVAGTYPNSQMWYTAVFSTFFGGTNPSGSNVMYTVTHELGHVFDDNHGQPSAGGAGAAFDLALQHDWLTLDFTDANGTIMRNPCGTIAGDGYIGPLQGVLDPSVMPMVQFCTGNVIEAKWLGKRTSQIVRDPTVYGQPFTPVMFQIAADSGTIGFNPGYVNQQGWREWHAEAFAIRAKGDTGSVPRIAIYSQMVANGPGYFACTAGPNSWVQTEYATAVVPAPGPCQTAMPGGWVHIPPAGQR